MIDRQLTWRRALPFTMFLLWALLVVTNPGPAEAQKVVRTLEQEFFAGEVGALHVDLPIGDLTVEGVEGSSAKATFEIECHRENIDKCRKRADRIRLVARIGKGTLHLRLKRTPRGRVHGVRARMHLRVPKQLALEVDVSGGNVLIGGMHADIEVDGVAGDVDISFPREKARAIKVDVGVGKADLWLSDGRIEGTGFPRSLSWQGSGDSKIEVDLGTGDVSVRLE